MSGFTITLDALLAMTVAVSLLVASTGLMAGVEFKKEDYLLRYTYDLLAVLEKDGTLDGAIDGNTSELDDLIAWYTPSHMCIKLDIYSCSFDAREHKWDESHFGHWENSCNESKTVLAASRLITHDGGIYRVTARTSYRAP